MSIYYAKDREKSDTCAENPLFIEIVNQCYGHECEFKKSDVIHDNEYSIDLYVDDDPVQYRFQARNSRQIYSPTIRYKRKNSKKNQQKSEWFKILNNKKNGNPYPKLLIWTLVDNLSNMNKIYEFRIIDIDELLKKYEEGYYTILNSDNQQPIEDMSNLKDTILGSWNEIDNRDGSSSFLVLSDLSDDVIKFTYSSQ